MRKRRLTLPRIASFRRSAICGNMMVPDRCALGCRGSRSTNAVIGAVAKECVSSSSSVPPRPTTKLNRSQTTHLRLMPAQLRRWNSKNSRLRSLLRSEEHTSELQSLMRLSYAVFCLKKKNKYDTEHFNIIIIYITKKI